MRPAHAALLLLLSPVPARASCGCAPLDVWSLVAGSDLVVEARLLSVPPGDEPGQPALVEVLRAHKGEAAGRLEVLLEREWVEACTARTPQPRLLLALAEGDRFVRRLEGDFGGPSPDPAALEALATVRRRAAGRWLSRPSPWPPCDEVERIEAVGAAVERIDAAQRAGAGDDQRRELLLTLAEERLLRPVALPALEWLPSAERAAGGLAAEEQARLASAFTRDAGIDASTPALLDLLEGYEDSLFDRSLLDALAEAVEPDEPEEPLTLLAVIGRLLGDEDQAWQVSRAAAGEPGLADQLDGRGLVTVSAAGLRRAVAFARERGGRRVSAPVEAGR